jgi:hypothetical protein
MSKNLRSLTLLAGIAVGLCVSGTATAQTAEDKLSIEALVKSGWQVAGYTSTFDNRSAMILLKHSSESYLVQCLAGYDVQRTPRVYVNCYGLR